MKFTSKSSLTLIFTVLFLCGGNAFARSQYLRTGAMEVLEAEGLRFKNFKDFKSLPLKPYNTYNYTDGSKRFSPYECWLHEEYVGRWGSGMGMLTIAKPSLSPPDNMPEHITAKAYSIWKEKGLKENKWDEEKLASWISAFSGVKVSEKPTPVKGVPSAIVVNKYFSGDDPSSKNYKEIYLAYKKRDSEKRFVFIYQIADTVDLKKSQRSIIKSLKSIAFFTPPKNKESKEKTTFVKKGEIPRSKEYNASRERVIKNIKNLDDWWYLETEDYILASDLKRKSLITPIQKTLIKCHEVYSKFYPIKKEIKEVSVVKVFKERNNYVAYVGKKYKWTAGVWMPSKRELVVSPSQQGSRSEKKGRVLAVVLHEGFHQYIYYAAQECNIGVWFNEGSAEFFETMVFKGKDKFEFELGKKTFAIYRDICSKRIDIDTFINMSHEDFYMKSSRGKNYAFAAALMYYLLKGAPSDKKYNYAAIPGKYYNSILKDGNPALANKVAWEGIDKKKFSDDLASFWGSKRKYRKSMRYDPLKDEKIER